MPAVVWRQFLLRVECKPSLQWLRTRLLSNLTDRTEAFAQVGKELFLLFFENTDAWRLLYFVVTDLNDPNTSIGATA
jgi:hypothetical protein